MLSSTPLEMENDFLFSKMNKSTAADQQESDQQENKIADLTNKLAIKDNQLGIVLDELNKKNVENSMVLNQSFTSDSTMYMDKMALQIQQLNEQLSAKTQQISDLNSCLVKQTNFCENLSNLLQQSQEKLNKFGKFNFNCDLIK